MFHSQEVIPNASPYTKSEREVSEYINFLYDCFSLASARGIKFMTLEEIDKREIICFGGVEVSALPSSESYDGKNGTVFPSPDPSLIPEIKPDTNSDYSY